VVLASEGHCLCGIDVAAQQQLRRRGSNRSLQDSIALLKDQLAAAEVSSSSSIWCLGSSTDSTAQLISQLLLFKMAAKNQWGQSSSATALWHLHLQVLQLASPGLNLPTLSLGQ
jgi:hypothetical protein